MPPSARSVRHGRNTWKAVRSGVAAVLSGVTGIVIWLD
jgi:hypothetical protein